MKRTLAVLLVLAGLGAYVYFFEFKAKEKEEAAEKKASRLITLNQLDIDRVELRNEHGEITLRKTGGEWQLTSPVSAPADQSTVRSLLTALTAAESKASIPDVSSLAGFGLEAPKITITVAEGGNVEVLKIGNRSPVSQDLYVQRGDSNTVYQTASGIETSAGRQPSEFRDKALFSFQASEVTAATITDGGKTISLERRGNDWLVASPVPLDADEGIASGLASDLANMRATGWLAEDASPAALAEYQLKAPATKITVTLIDGNTHTLHLGKQVGSDRAAQVAGTNKIVTVADWSAKNLLKTPAELRERKLVVTPRERIAKLVFTTGATTTTFTRAGSGWSSGADASVPTDGAKVEEFLNALGELRATEWHLSTPQTQREHGLNNPGRTLTLYDESGRRLRKLSFGNSDDDWAVWIQTEDKTMEAKAPNDLVKNKWPVAGGE